LPQLESVNTVALTYVRVKRAEWKDYHNSVSRRELDRYLRQY